MTVSFFSRAGDVLDWVDLERYDNNEQKTMVDTPLLVNIKGCGYPPEIDCAAFTTKYANLSENDSTFPCYYSKVRIGTDVSNMR